MSFIMYIGHRFMGLGSRSTPVKLVLKAAGSLKEEHQRLSTTTRELHDEVKIISL